MRRSLSPLEIYYVQRDALRFPSVSFTPENRQHIAAELPKASKARLGKLFNALEGVISIYQAWIFFETNHAPSSTLRRKLRLLVNRIRKLEQVMLNLDWGTRRALAPFAADHEHPLHPVLSVGKPQTMVQLDARLYGVSDNLAVVAAAAERYLAHTTPKKGGPRKFTARDAFVVEIADCLSHCVPGAVQINSTIGGKFENIVAICLRAAGHGSPGDIHRIVLAALKGYRSDFRLRKDLGTPT